jgi:hypothetical protein
LIALGLLDREEVSPTTFLELLVEAAKVSLAIQLRTGAAPYPKGHCGEAGLAAALGSITAEATFSTDRVSAETISFDLALLTRRPRLGGSSPSCAKVSSRRPPGHDGLAIVTSCRGDTTVAMPMKP